MIYHLDDIDNDTGEYLNYYYKRKDVGKEITTAPESGLYKANAGTHYADYDTEYIQDSEQMLQFLDLPTTYKLYAYREQELLAKLYSVKLWLEKYILGVNCYISDICAEGIILERFKTQGYVTEHHFDDFNIVGNFTPNVIDVSTFKDSSTELTCTLNEFSCLTLENYEDVPIESFIVNSDLTNDKNETIYVSAPLCALTVANEYQFILENREVSCGSLVEFTDTSYIDNPILVRDNKLEFYSDTKNISKIKKECLPIIEVLNGNLRYCHGDWDNNIRYSINSVLDQVTGKQLYNIYDNET